MKRFLTIMVVVLVTSGLVACSKSHSWNQKLTVTIETPNGIRTGSAVTRVSAKVGGQSILSQAIVSYYVEGEATIVDLGNGKYLFALLSNGGDYTPTEYWAQRAFRNQLVGDLDPYRDEKEQLSEFFEKLGASSLSSTLLLDQYPLLVTFTDLNDPKSVKAIEPDNLSDTFGPGYKLKSITIETTDEDVTKGRVEKLLGWMNQENPIFIEWTKYPTGNPLLNVHIQSFKMGG
jgi:hypothetical protein